MFPCSKKKKRSQIILRWSAGLPAWSGWYVGFRRVLDFTAYSGQLKQAKTILNQIRPNSLGWFKQVFEAVLF